MRGRDKIAWWRKLERLHAALVGMSDPSCKGYDTAVHRLGKLRDALRKKETTCIRE